MCVCFTLSALLGPAGRLGLGGINAATLQETEKHLNTLTHLCFTVSQKQRGQLLNLTLKCV